MRINANFSKLSLPEMLFIKFSLELMTISPFSEFVRLQNLEYKMNALVRHLGTHFTCAGLEENGCTLMNLQPRNSFYVC